MRRFITALLIASAFPLSGCTGGITRALSDGVLNHNDPAMVRDGLPAYLILIDGLVQDDPDDTDLLLPAARLYTAYSASFVDDRRRAQRLATRARDYARRALCEELESACAAAGQDLDAYRGALERLDDEDEVPVLYVFASAWANWVQHNSGDWQAISDLPKIEQTFKKILELDETYDHGNAHLYMGVILTLRPAALGGQPEQGRRHFLRAVEISQGRNLMAKVLYARHYARLVFNRQLHDRLLEEVTAAEIEQPGLTLSNALAREQAEELLESSEEYF